ncbi:Elongation factor [Thalictrum thalictroides]|uniref:Elongation factor n=1 Tax=Thalictrum thalictroides TaxID=46969 RepID=A0A7J6W415_THATH|nr:Elongation factor [Thalictrum thalictroides]
MSNVRVRNAAEEKNKAAAVVSRSAPPANFPKISSSSKKRSHSSIKLFHGVVVVVDCIKGVRLQTENVLRQAFGERIRPVLALNKIDQCFKLHFDGEEAYQMFQQVIENANVVMATCTYTCLGDVRFDPVKGNVAFSSGLYGWAFTLTNFSDWNRRDKDDAKASGREFP